MTDQMRVSGAAHVLTVEDDTAEIMVRVLNSIRSIEQGQQQNLESLREVRSRLQVLETAYLRTLGHLQLVSSDINHITTLVLGRSV